MAKRVSDLLQQGKEDGWFETNIINNAPLIMSLFANIMVIVADVRAFDVVYTLTSSWWKAGLAALSCGVTFIIWELCWQYNNTTEGWRRVSLGMAGLAFATSILLGVADYLQFSGTWADWLLGGVVVVTGVHTVVGLFYAYNDPDVARRRNKKQALAMMVDQELNAQVATELLQNGSNLLAIIGTLEKQYGPDEVEKVIAILQGKKQNKPSLAKGNNQQFKPANVYASETEPAKPANTNGSKPNPTQAGR